MALLGEKARDPLSGFEGIVVARTEWLYGCVRLALQPRGLHEGKPIEAQWFDQAQVEVVEEKPIATSLPAPTGGGNEDGGRAHNRP